MLTLGWVDVLVLAALTVVALVAPILLKARLRRMAREVWGADPRGWSGPVEDDTRRAVAAAASSLGLGSQPVWRYGGFRSRSEATAWWSRYRAINPARAAQGLLAIVAEESPEPGRAAPARR